MASITKRCRHRGPARETCGCAYYIRDRKGGRDTYTPVGPDRAAAEAALGRLARVPRETVAQTMDAWVAMKAREPGARFNSLAAYRSRAKTITTVMGHIATAALRPEHVMGLVEEMFDKGRAPSTVQGVYSALRGALKHARRRGVIKTLPLPEDGPGIPGSRPREHDLTLAQVEEVIGRIADHTWRLVAEFVFLTGLRWGEAVAIRLEDVRGATVRVELTQHKGGGTNAPKSRAGYRTIPLSPRARAILAELDLPVGGKQWKAQEILVEAMGPLHKPGMGWHTLRNAHAMLLDAAGTSLREANRRMGHETLSQTLAYRLSAEVGNADALDEARHRSPQVPASSAEEVEG